ncbi:hypothetical protein M1L60_37205 [Actinoplanes sp. TRM 88003]|uniref:HEAT repeat domain-containing protein n=1 Tax=Paractinoplanes aksuensis TaxID=2939490 RepID=A0ABT1DZM4_9ACTN|nr:hypothetical protein [Actinoplanes aksuensis]MCO8276232.1 hypothetical protein [Actinoplanes aksuensis]
MSSAVVDSALEILDRFAVEDASTASPDEHTAWAEALIDSGDEAAAAEQLIALLRAGSVPNTLPGVAARLSDERARSVLAAAIDNGRVTTALTARAHLAGGFARLASGSDDAEAALLRAVLAVEEFEDQPEYGPHRERMHRIAAVFAALSEAHPGEPERLDRWAAILGEADRPRLAAAAGLLGPLGLAEIDRRCGDPVTDARLPAVLDALDSANLRPYEPSIQVAVLLHGVFVLAGPALRAELLDTRAAMLRARLSTRNPQHVDIGLAAGLIETGRAGEGAALLRALSAGPDRRYGFSAELLITAAARAGLPEHDPDLFAEVFGLVASLSAYPPPLSPAPAVRLGPGGRATAARLIDRSQPNRNPGRLSGWLAEAAARTGDFDTLGILLEKATDEPRASFVARHLAAARARHGDRPGADTLAEACGLPPTSPAAA